MSTTTVSVRLDSDTKEKFDKVADSVGLSSSAAIGVFIKKFTDYGGFPFPVTNRETDTDMAYARTLDEVFRQMRDGGRNHHDLLEV